MAQPHPVAQGRADALGEARMAFHAPPTAAVGLELVLRSVVRFGCSHWAAGPAVADQVVFAASPAPPGGNVLPVIPDDLGLDSVSAQGSPVGAPTPRLDVLAAEGMRFDNVRAMPICAPTRLVDDTLAEIDALQEPWLVTLSFHVAHASGEPPPANLHNPASSSGCWTASPRPPRTPPPSSCRATTAPSSPRRSCLQPPPQQARGVRRRGEGAVPGDRADRGAGHGVHLLRDGGGLFPTLADLDGVDVAQLPGPIDRTQPLRIDGVSLLPVLADPTEPVHDLLSTERFAPGGDLPRQCDRRSVRDRRCKLVYDAIDDREQFFEDVSGAVDEGPDLIGRGRRTPERELARAGLRARMDAMVADLPMDAAPMVDDLAGGQIGDRNDDLARPP